MKQILQKIFSAKRKGNRKILTVLGIKIKFKQKKKISLEQRIKNLENIISNIDYKQNLIFDYYLNPAEAKPAYGALRDKQKDEIELFLEFKRICEKYNIEYWVDFGTLLGAKRHGGFIPWDDDLDVSMLHSDVLRFKECWEKEPEGKYKFLFWKGEQCRLIFSENNASFIDIYAYDDLGDRIKYKQKINIVATRRSVPKYVIYPLSKITFEGTEVSCPNDVESYLQVRYGNWHCLPHSKCNIPGHTPVQKFKIYYKEEN